KLVADRGRRLDEDPGRGREQDPGRTHPDRPTPPAGTLRDTAGGAARTWRGETPGGLPRRVRQANLAPQLRDAAAERPGASGRPDPGDAERDAEAVRSRMASLQHGWQRGRRQNEAEESAGRAGGPTGGTPGTTSEGNGR
ncbi:histidine kinase, partial [Streptomyces fuscigenes]|nr:histidine kinase [Streptomyces fuscigenes]